MTRRIDFSLVVSMVPLHPHHRHPHHAERWAWLRRSRLLSDEMSSLMYARRHTVPLESHIMHARSAKGWTSRQIETLRHPAPTPAEQKNPNDAKLIMEHRRHDPTSHPAEHQAATKNTSRHRLFQNCRT